MKNMYFLAAIFILVAFLATACGGGGSGDGGSTVNTGGSSGGPDIAVTGFTGVSTATINTSYQVSFTVVNNGSAAASFSPRVNLSPGSDLDTDASRIGVQYTTVLLNPGQSTVINITVNIPNGLASGTYYMGPSLSVVGDTNLANNTMSAPVSIAGLACTDDAFEADNGVASSKALLLGVPQTHNHCNASSDWMRFDAVAGTVYGFNTIKLGTNAALLRVVDSDGTMLLATSQSSSYSYSNSATAQRLSWTAPHSGTFYLRASPTSPMSSVGPNTDYVVSLGDMRPDLVPRNPYAATWVYAGGILDTSVQVSNIGFAPAGASTLTWFLSGDPVITSADLPLLTINVSALNVEETFTQYSTQVPVPGTVAPGTWYIGVLANSDASVDEYSQVNNATVGAAINVLGLTNCLPDAYEDDDTIGTAKALVVGAAAQQHNLCDDGSDWYQFTAAANTSYHITSGKSYTVYGPDTVSALTLDTKGNFTATQSGTYYAHVLNGYFPNQGASDYTMKLDLALPDLNFYTALNYWSNTVNAGGWIDVGMTIQNTGFLPSASYEWSIHRSNNIALDASAPLIVSGTMPALDDRSFMAFSTPRVYFDKTLAPGTYYLRGALDRANTVAEVSESNNLSDAVTITVTAPPCAVDAFEDDDSPATSSTIAEATTQTHNNCDDTLDWVKFTAPANAVYLATAYRSIGSPSITVLESDATTAAQIQRSEIISKGSTVPYQASWTAVAGNTYYLKVDDSNNFLSNSGYSYTLTVNQCLIDAFEDDDTFGTAKPAVLGVLQTRNHCEDDDDWILLDATQGTSYTVVATNVGPASTVAVDLYDSTGTNKLVSGTSYSGGKTREIRGWVAPATGTYYIRLYQNFAVGWGENTGYTVQIN